MSDWEETSWGDIAILEYGKAVNYKDSDGQVPVYGTNGQIGFTDHQPLCNFSSVIIGRKGAYRGVHYSPIPFCVIDTAFYLKPINRNSLDLKFAYYKLLTQDINRLDSGSAIPSTSREDFYHLELSLPPIDEQKKIAAILTCLDRKIENLCKQNETLERIAQTLFKHWFVDFEFPNKDGKPYKSSGGAIERSELGEFPVGWPVRRFDSLGELNRGKSKHRPRDAKHLYGGKYPFIQTGDIKSSQGFITEYKQTYSEFGLAQSRLWKKETLCITIAANIAETGILTFPSCFPDSVIGFVADSNICDIFFIHRMFKFKRPEIENEAIGSVQKNLNLETITKIKFVIPNLKNNEDLVKIFRKFGERIIANKQQIQTLTKTRNVLLPQLMSGKLRITE
jgi:type I restriction enzyme S subunit